MRDAVRATMLIRAAPRAVFDAFVEPRMLRQFWLRDASAPLAPGAQVTWEFMVPGVTARPMVTRFDVGRRLGIRWEDGTEVDLEFEPIDGTTTRVVVSCRGFGERELLEQATTTIEGYSIVLCDLKTLLELGRSANLVRDKAELITRSRGDVRRVSGA
jgi:uncharacterized protein YndB with AHSA1/START domain